MMSRAAPMASHVDDVGSLRDHLNGAGDGPIRIQSTITGERIVVDIQNSHQKRVARERDLAIAGMKLQGGIADVLLVSRRILLQLGLVIRVYGFH